MNKILLKLEIINELLRLFDKYPDWRFCQLLHNILYKGRIMWHKDDIFYITDKEFLEILKGE